MCYEWADAENRFHKWKCSVMSSARWRLTWDLIDNFLPCWTHGSCPGAPSRLSVRTYLDIPRHKYCVYVNYLFIYTYLINILSSVELKHILSLIFKNELLRKIPTSFSAFPTNKSECRAYFYTNYILHPRDFRVFPKTMLFWDKKQPTRPRV